MPGQGLPDPETLTSLRNLLKKCWRLQELCWKCCVHLSCSFSCDCFCSLLETGGWIWESWVYRLTVWALSEIYEGHASRQFIHLLQATGTSISRYPILSAKIIAERGLIAQQACFSIPCTLNANASPTACSANSDVIDAGISKHISVVGNEFLVNQSSVHGNQRVSELMHEGIHRWKSKILVRSSSKYIKI